MTAFGLLASPLLGGATGWLVSWMTIQMLFRPHRPIRFLGLEWQGLIPRRRSELARHLAELITRSPQGGRDLAALLSDAGWETEVRDILDRVMETDVEPSALRKVPLVGGALDRLLSHARATLSREILAKLDRHRDLILERLQSRIDVGKFIVQRVDALDPHRLETAVLGPMRRELQVIVLFGGILGFLAGCLHPLVAWLL